MNEIAAIGSTRRSGSPPTRARPSNPSRPVSVLVEVNTELRPQELAALLGDGDRAVGLAALDPAELEQPRGEGCTEAAGDVQLALAPVEAAAHDGSPLALEPLQLDLERCKAALGSPTDRITAVPADDDLVLLEGASQGDAEPAREVVVARARLAQELAPRRLAQRAWLGLRRDD